MKYIRLIIFSLLLAAGLSPSLAKAGLLLEQLSPNPTVYQLNVDWLPFPEVGGFPGSPDGKVTAFLDAVDLGSGNSGCEAGDFAGFTAGSIALMERGTCFFSAKILNAEAVGAVGAIIFDNIVQSLSEILPALADPVSIVSVFTINSVGTDLAALLALGDVRIRIEVPEPSTLALFGLGLAGLGFMRRRRKMTAVS